MTPSKPTGIFLTIEGIEGVGKTTAVKLIQEYLTTVKQDFVLTREPGGTPVAEHIRHLLLTPHVEETLLPETELLLMFACRAQHIAKTILPALQAGKWVVSDRFVDASFAYQGGGRGIALTKIKMLERWIVDKLSPTLTILLDAPPAIGLARAKHRGPQDRIEQEKIEFFARVRKNYLDRAAQNKKRFCIIDATQPLPIVEERLKDILNKLWSKTHSLSQERQARRNK